MNVILNGKHELNKLVTVIKILDLLISAGRFYHIINSFIFVYILKGCLTNSQVKGFRCCCLLIEDPSLVLKILVNTVLTCVPGSMYKNIIFE